MSKKRILIEVIAVVAELVQSEDWDEEPHWSELEENEDEYSYYISTPRG